MLQAFFYLKKFTKQTNKGLHEIILQNMSRTCLAHISLQNQIIIII